jgi:antitoxin component of RelBE/YafQ-DinJ toxin-antitoxin module
MYLNIDDELKKELQKEAKEKGLSLTAYIRLLLIERKK